MPDVPVLHRDDDLIVVDKPPGILVVPAPGRSGENLTDRLSRQLATRVFAVHRLDEDTTGVMVFALNEGARAQLEALFREHAIERDYLALLSSNPSPPAGKIESNLLEGPDGIMRVVPRGGQRAVTHYQSLGRRGRCCLVRCRLETGRRNQIRAHMSAIGCPIAGDRKYGYRSRDQESFRRPMLHSWRLRFCMPGDPTRVIEQEALPPEIELRP